MSFISCASSKNWNNFDLINYSSKTALSKQWETVLKCAHFEIKIDISIEKKISTKKNIENIFIEALLQLINNIIAQFEWNLEQVKIFCIFLNVEYKYLLSCTLTNYYISSSVDSLLLFVCKAFDIGPLPILMPDLYTYTISHYFLSIWRFLILWLSLFTDVKIWIIIYIYIC